MDMKRVRRQSHTSPDPLKGEDDGEAMLPFSHQGKKNGVQISIPAFVLLIFFIGVMFFVLMSGVHQSEPMVTIAGAGSGGGGEVKTALLSSFRNSESITFFFLSFYVLGLLLICRYLMFNSMEVLIWVK